jgi:hypothetical protein
MRPLKCLTDDAVEAETSRSSQWCFQDGSTNSLSERSMCTFCSPCCSPFCSPFPMLADDDLQVLDERIKSQVSLSPSHEHEHPTPVLSILLDICDRPSRETPVPTSIWRHRWCVCSDATSTVNEVASHTSRACLPTMDQLAVRSFCLPALTEMSHSPIKRI